MFARHLDGRMALTCSICDLEGWRGYETPWSVLSGLGMMAPLLTLFRLRTELFASCYDTAITEHYRLLQNAFYKMEVHSFSIVSDHLFHSFLK